MKALILSCNTGGGHNAAANALQEAFTMRGHEAQVLDYLSLAGKQVSRAVGGSYVELVKYTPKAFGAVYGLGMAVSTHTRRSPVYYANSAMARYLSAYLEEHPADAVLATHVFAAETLTWMKRHGEPLPLTVTIGTDYTCIPFWEETDCDYYVLPHGELAEEYIRRGVPAEKLVPLGIPVSPKFLHAPKKAEARAALGLPQGRRIQLVVGGSMGSGDLGRLTEELSKRARPEDFLLVICGSNRRKQESLRERFCRNNRITVYGRTDKMPLLLSACDILYTKPGGLTSTEAAVSGIPLVHTDPIPGCETANRAFFLNHGMCVSGKNAREQAAAGIALLGDAQALAAMRSAQSAGLPAAAAEEICRFTVEALAAGRR